MPMLLLSLLSFALLGSFDLMAKETAVSAPNPLPPKAEKRIKITKMHGKVLEDPYHWLREREAPEVREHLEAENAYAAAHMKGTEALQEKIFQEIKGRMKETDMEVPARYNGYYFYSRTEEGKQYRIYCRKKGSLKAKEEVLLDINALKKELKVDYISLGDFELSPDQNILAYSIDTNGEEFYTIYFKDLTTGKLLKDRIVDAYGSFEWANDNKTIFYNRVDKAHRPYQIYRHQLGDDPKKEKLLFTEPDEEYSVGISKTKTEKYLFIESGAKTSDEVWYLDANQPLGEFQLIQKRKPKLEYDVYHHEKLGFVIVTNDSAKNFRVVTAPEKKPSRKNWKNLVAHKKSRMIEYLVVFKDYIVIFERHQGLDAVRVLRVKDKKLEEIKFKEAVYSVRADDNYEYDTKLLRFAFESPITPQTIFDYDLKKKTRELLKQKEIPGGFKASNYRTERVFAKAKDGTKIPITLLYHKKFKKNAKAPLYLTGYGSYGASYDPYFSIARFSMVDRGFVTGICHPRGGSEMGRHWYESGKLLKKKNTFKDFIACVEHLKKKKYVDPKKIAIQGGSAGGLLMGAVINMRPQLAKVVVADVPFVDVINTMLDKSLRLTVGEYQEWGNPYKKRFFEYIYSYSPYENIKPAKYPEILATAGINDTRVNYWEPAKWVQRLRENNQGKSIILLKTDMGSGHSGPSGRYDFLKEIAYEYTFVIARLGMN